MQQKEESYQEHVKQLTWKMQQEREQLIREQDKIISLKLQEQERLLKEGFQNESRRLHQEIQNLRSHKPSGGCTILWRSEFRTALQRNPLSRSPLTGNLQHLKQLLLSSTHVNSKSPATPGYGHCMTLGQCQRKSPSVQNACMSRGSAFCVLEVSLTCTITRPRVFLLYNLIFSSFLQYSVYNHRAGNFLLTLKMKSFSFFWGLWFFSYSPSKTKPYLHFAFYFPAVTSCPEVSQNKCLTQVNKKY